MARLLGAHSPTQLVGHGVRDFLAPEAWPAFEERAAGLLAGRAAPHVEQKLIKAGDGRVDVEVASAVIVFEGESAILSLFQDITEQRRAEEAYRESERRFRRLVEGEMVGIIEVNASGIAEANQAFLNMLGRSRAEFETGALKWQELTPPEFANIDREKLQELLETGECKPFEKEFVRPDGSRVPVLLASSLLAPPPEWRAICLVTDLTDRHKLQEVRAEKMRLESVGVLAAGLAHSLNNLLTAVIGNASLLVEHQMISENSRASAVVREIIESGQRAAKLTSQLLAYAGQGRFVVGEIRIRDVIEDQIQRMRPGIPENIRLTLELADDLPVILADPNQLRHMIQGVVNNAIEAIGSRPGGLIEIAARREHVGSNALHSPGAEPLPAGAYCILEVRDNGSGMDTNTLAHAFDPFFSTKFPGRGLGLAAVAGMVRASHGAIRVSSTPEVGSVFQVYLPERQSR
jgi:PAS domain S-box-containing protein